MGNIYSLLPCRKKLTKRKSRKKSVQLSLELASEKTLSPKVNPMAVESLETSLKYINYRKKGLDGFPVHGWIHACSNCGIPTGHTIPGEDISMCKKCYRYNLFTL